MSGFNRMGSDGNFGRGPRELTGAVDLISRYQLLNHHSFFCKKPLPLAISDTNYLHNVVGDTEIRKGEGMELDQLFQDAYLREKTSYIQPFDMETLGQAFQLRETAPVDLSSAEKGTPTISGKPKIKSKDKVKKHKRHKEKDKDKYKDQKKHKHRHKDRSKDKDKDKEKEKEKEKEKKKDKSVHHDLGGDRSKKHHEKKRKHEGVEDLASGGHNHKKATSNGNFTKLATSKMIVVSMDNVQQFW
uniref:Mediator of RNA polymerase II transcription subunit 19a n=1 Tax=Leersia perrieri TaxID=77586 RepID=A0A0D9VWS1_9ORYZ